jgi:hypothetical protein
MKIDIFTHILPLKYKDALYNVLDSKFTKSFQDAIPTLFDLDLRFRPGLYCAYAFFGAQHLLFGTDMPFDIELGQRYTRETIEAIE